MNLCHAITQVKQALGKKKKKKVLGQQLLKDTPYLSLEDFSNIKASFN